MVNINVLSLSPFLFIPTGSVQGQCQTLLIEAVKTKRQEMPPAVQGQLLLPTGTQISKRENAVHRLRSLSASLR